VKAEEEEDADEGSDLLSVASHGVELDVELDGSLAILKTSRFHKDCFAKEEKSLSPIECLIGT
jgi:hypothetical protein